MKENRQKRLKKRKNKGKIKEFNLKILLSPLLSLLKFSQKLKTFHKRGTAIIWSVVNKSSFALKYLTDAYLILFLAAGRLI